MEIKINVNFGAETINAINNLAGALSSLSNINLSTTQATQVTVPSTPTAQETTTPPVHTPVVQDPVPATTAPVVTPVAATVPTAAVSYTRDDLARAGGFLMEQNRGPELTAVLARYGVQALTELPVELYGNFAADLRALGANI